MFSIEVGGCSEGVGGLSSYSYLILSSFSSYISPNISFFTVVILYFVDFLFLRSALSLSNVVMFSFFVFTFSISLFCISVSLSFYVGLAMRYFILFPNIYLSLYLSLSFSLALLFYSSISLQHGVKVMRCFILLQCIHLSCIVSQFLYPSFSTLL